MLLEPVNRRRTYCPMGRKRTDECHCDSVRMRPLKCLSKVKLTLFKIFIKVKLISFQWLFCSSLNWAFIVPLFDCLAYSHWRCLISAFSRPMCCRCQPLGCCASASLACALAVAASLCFAAAVKGFGSQVLPSLGWGATILTPSPMSLFCTLSALKPSRWWQNCWRPRCQDS